MRLPSVLQEFIHKSRYARYVDKLKRRESWPETVKRYMDFAQEHIEENYPRAVTHWQTQAPHLEQGILSLGVMPSMRLLMTAGEAVKRDGIAAYNCYYHAINKKRKFADTLHILLNGTGVGFSCERQEIAKLPQIADEFVQVDDVISVADSKRGWSAAYKKLISSLFLGEVPMVDYSKVRPAGSRLKTFGGRSSGPQPLRDLFDFTTEIFRSAAGRKLTSIEVHDIICKIADVVVVGGVRRSALISLSNLSDRRMREAKTGKWWEDNPQRALANNSAVYTDRPDMETFMDEFFALVKSKSGERGIFSRIAAQKQASKWGRRDMTAAYGTNPCCFTGDMKLLTKNGYEYFSDLEGKSVEIVNADGHATKGTVWSSGVKPVIEVRFQADRDSITCTPDHVFMLNDGSECQAQYLAGRRVMSFFKMKDVFSREDFFAGFIQGDGATGRLESKKHRGMEVYIGKNDKDIADLLGIPEGRVYLREAKEIAMKYNLHSDSLPSRRLPAKVTDDFLSGLYSANGSVIKNGRVAFKTSCRSLADALVLALFERNIRAHITTNIPTEVEFSNGTYLCKESYDVNIAKHIDIIKFAEAISFGQQYKRDALRELIKNKSPYVRKITPIGDRTVYDFTEPSTHWGVVSGVVVHNSEIILLDGEFCNLTEVVVRAGDTLDDLKRKVELCTIMGTLQSTLTDFDFIDPIVKENCEKERLLGVSMTGVMDHPILNTVSDEAKSWLVLLRDHAREVNEKWAALFGINISAAITCNKPSGTVGQLTNVGTGGLHPRFSQYYIRTVRQDNKDPLTQFLKEQGVPHEADISKPDNTTIFSFPVKGPKEAVFRDDRTAIQQLEHWLMFQRSWCEHKPSITIYVKEHEWLDVGAWVYKYFDEVSGVSFLPFSDHTYRQAPFQVITEDQYHEWLTRTPEVIDWDAFIEEDDTTISSQELACSGGACSVE